MNRFDQIKRRAERCRRDILDQILEISPSTYADAPNLVHFVSARQCLQETPENPSSLLDFMSLEDCLRSFILDKRSKSKLAPAKIYLNNVLSDLSLLASHNADQEREVEKVARRDAAAAAPDLHCMQALKAAHVDGLDLVIDAITHQIQTSTLSRLEDWIEGMEAEFEDAVEWPGGFWWFGGGGGPWVYVERLVRVIAECREYEVKECERLAVDLCLYTVNNVEELMRKDMSPSLANTLIGGDECATEEEKSSGGGGHRERFGIDRSLLSAEALFGSGNANNNCNTASLSRDFDMIMEEGNNNNNSSSSMLLAPISSATASGAVGKLSVADRLDFAKEFAPSSAVVLTGVLGYSGLFKSLMRVIRGGVGGVSSSMLTNALEKTLFVGLTIAGELKVCGKERSGFKLNALLTPLPLPTAFLSSHHSSTLYLQAWVYSSMLYLI